MALTKMEPRPIETSGVTQTAQFKLKANGKAFKVLIDGLYSDKVRAVIRELWSNAYDAHAVVGKTDTPFSTHLPTAWEPYFSVRDYGCSMDHDQIMNLYSTVFESSKEHDNTQVGRLGLGSKSPFAYTDTFTVTAWLNGVRRTYSAYIGSDYIPQIAFMDEASDDQPNGIEVTFPTKEGDEDAFRRAARHTLMGFPIIPEISGPEIDTNVRGTPYLSGNGWGIYSNIACAFARQGCVVYPLDANAVKGITQQERSILDAHIIVDFPIGDLEITASREGLGYDTTTIANIRKRASEVYNEILATAKVEIDGCETIWDKMVLLNRLSTAYVPSTVVNELRKEVFGALQSSLKVDLFSNKWKPLEFKSYGRDKLSQSSAPKRHGNPTAIDFDPDNIAVVFLYDIAKGMVPNQWGRMREYMDASSHRFAKAYYVRFDSRTNDIGAYVRNQASGVPDELIVDLDKCPKPAPQYRGPRAKIKARKVNASYGGVGDWAEVDIDTAKGGYYIFTKRKEFVGLSYGGSGSTVRGIVTRLRALGLVGSSDEVYAIPMSLSKNITKENGWINIIDLAKEICEDAAPALREIVCAQRMKRNVGASRVHPALLNRFPSTHPIRVYEETCAAIRNARDFNPTEKEIKDLGSNIGFQPWEQDHASLELPEWSEATAAYTLLQYVSEINHSNIEDVLDYVNLVDSRKKKDQAA